MLLELRLKKAIPKKDWRQFKQLLDGSGVLINKPLDEMWPSKRLAETVDDLLLWASSENEEFFADLHNDLHGRRL